MVVSTYGQKAIDALVNYLADPSQLCGVVGLCSSEKKILNITKLSPSNDVCTECKQIVGTVDMVLKNKAAQQEIITVMNEVCSLLPASIQGTCTMVVSTYGQK